MLDMRVFYFANWGWFTYKSPIPTIALPTFADCELESQRPIKRTLAGRQSPPACHGQANAVDDLDSATLEFDQAILISVAYAGTDHGEVAVFCCGRRLYGNACYRLPANNNIAIRDGFVLAMGHRVRPRDVESLRNRATHILVWLIGQLKYQFGVFVFSDHCLRPVRSDVPWVNMRG